MRFLVRFSMNRLVRYYDGVAYRNGDRTNYYLCQDRDKSPRVDKMEADEILTWRLGQDAWLVTVEAE